jgi:GNAT superfamily N-acetyltransferase
LETTARQIPEAVDGYLDDGTRIRFRPIRPEDKELLVEGIKGMSPESRYRRFFRDVDHLSEDQLRYLTEVDGVDHVAWIAVLPDVPGEPGVGVARWIRLRDEPEVAEAAVTVMDAWHNRGIGRALLFIIGKAAVDQGIRQFRVWILGQNSPVLTLMKAFGATAGRWESGVLEMTVPLPADPVDFDSSIAPQVLKAAARGDLQGRVHADGPLRTELEAGPRKQVPD